ncbi:unnamed protein product [Plutella xylostella]|uniref:Mediator of RNA polymerase II transcription subunit 25 n=1 Tax=Plutella xylostella TaxID=51655 RepID=A0A8S4F8V1_PLUXY|nr:unnamed protein product [Plutella xylostella]
MVVTATETPSQAQVIFIIEATAANGAYINELKTNYIIPTLEYFHGGPLEEGGGNGSVYGVVTYLSADCHPGQPVATYGPLTCPQSVIETVDKLQFIGGASESRACITEALTTAVACFEQLGRSDAPRHAVLLCCQPPYCAAAGPLLPQGTPTTVEQACRQLSEAGVQLSLVSGRRCAALPPLYELAGGDLHKQHQRNYAKSNKRAHEISRQLARNLFIATGGQLPPPAPTWVRPWTVEQACRQLSEAGVQLSLVSGRRCAALPPLYELAGGDLHKQHQRNYAKTVEQACRQLSEAGVQLSLVSGRRCAALPPLYELAGGDLHKQHQRNYAKVDT